MSRTSLTRQIRANCARKNYYAERAVFFEDINRKHMQVCMAATVYRQWYYEQKIKFMEDEQKDKEAAQMKTWEANSAQYMNDWAEELAREEDEAHAALEEDLYRA